MSQRGEVIGFVGLGNMGGAICNRLVEAGYSVFVYDLRVEAIQSLVDVGAQSCASAWECATNADLLFTSLPRPDHVEELMGGVHGALQAMRPDSVWVAKLPWKLLCSHLRLCISGKKGLGTPVVFF